MPWIEMLNTRVRDGECNSLSRINDLSHVGREWWAVSSEGDVWHWDSKTRAPERCAEGQGHVRAIAMSPGGRVGWLGRLPMNPAHAQLARTEDGGATWQPVEVPPGAPRAICALEARDAEHAWAVGAFFASNKQPGCLRTRDGIRWEAVALNDPQLSALTDITFLKGDPGRGVIAGGRNATPSSIEPALFFTDDGGEHWSPAAVPSGLAGRYCWKLHFVAEDVGFASLTVASASNLTPLLLKTADGGRSWQRQGVAGVDPLEGAPPDLQAVAFKDQTLGWVCARQHTLLETRDRGASWTTTEGPCDVNRILIGDMTVAAGKALYVFED